MVPLRHAFGDAVGGAVSGAVRGKKQAVDSLKRYRICSTFVAKMYRGSTGTAG